jgi:hypothetical protein
VHSPTSWSSQWSLFFWISHQYPICIPLLHHTGGLNVGIKRLDLEANYSPSSSAEVKNAWSYTSTSIYIFVAWCVVKRKDQSIFSYIYFRDEIRANFVDIEYRIWFYQDYKVVHVTENCVGITCG